MPIYAFNGTKPQLGEKVWVAPTADVIGNVVLEESAVVLFGVVIRADNSEIRIGAETNVQDNSVLHSDVGVPLTVGKRVTIGHNVTLHGCTIEDDVLIGMGSTVLNNAVIGSGSLVGANALVTEGKVFPPRSLIVGSPAKAIRELTDADVENIRASAAGYVARGAEFAAGLSEIDQARGPE